MSELVSELLRHGHTVVQYRVRVEIPTKARRISHGTTRSSALVAMVRIYHHYDSGFGCPDAISVPTQHTPLPGETLTPAISWFGGGTHVSDVCESPAVRLWIATRRMLRASAIFQ